MLVLKLYNMVTKGLFHGGLRHQLAQPHIILGLSVTVEGVQQPKTNA